MAKTSTVIEHRSELKQRIKQIAGKRFHKDGIRAVKMDDISQQLGISKRTLYEIYPAKEDLLYESMMDRIERDRQQLQGLSEKGATVMEILMEFYKKRIEEFSDVNPLFLEDLCHYPRVNEFLQSIRDQQLEHAKKFLLKGQEQGYFIKSMNVDLVVAINNECGRYVMDKQLYRKYPTNIVFKTLIRMFIRGFCTPLGIEYIDNCLDKIE